MQSRTRRSRMPRMFPIERDSAVVSVGGVAADTPARPLKAAKTAWPREYWNAGAPGPVLGVQAPELPGGPERTVRHWWAPAYPTRRSAGRIAGSACA